MGRNIKQNSPSGLPGYPDGRMTYALDPVPVWVAMPGYRIVPPEVGDTMALPAAYSLFRKDVAEMLDQVYK